MAPLLILLLGGLVALFIANRDLKARLDRLEARVDGRLPAPEISEQGPSPDAAPATAPPEPGAFIAEPPFEEREEDEQGEGLAGLFERLVGGRLLIWIGGVALAVAGIFLIRYSIEIGLVTPALRMIAAALFGLVLLGAGEYARAGRLLADDPRIAQALVGAGLAVLYAATYGSHILYGLIGPGLASALMLAVTAAALVLSLRHGAPTAVMGLIGGFLTPALVGDPDAGAVPLLAYLALLNGAIFAISWRSGWTWLAAAAVGLSFVWTAVLLAGPADDALAAGAFVVALAVAATVLRPGEGRQLSLIQPAAIGIVQLAVLVARVDLGAAAWALFGALAAASMILALLRPRQRFAPPLALGLALALLLAKATTGQDPFVPWAAAGATLIFGLGGAALAAWRRDLLWTAVAGFGLAGPALIVRAARPELLDAASWGLLLVVLALGPVLLVWRNRERAREEGPADLALLVSGGLAALLIVAATPDLLPLDALAAVWAALAILVALAARRLRDLALSIVAVTVAAVAAARSVWMVPELSVAGIGALVGEPVLATDLPDAAEAFWALALPAALFFALWRTMPPLLKGARRALPAVAGLFAVTALYVWFKRLYGLDSGEDFVARGFLERTILTQALFLIGWLLATGRVRLGRVEPEPLRAAGSALTALAAARLVWFDMLVLNPAWEPQWVGTLPLLNLLLPAFFLSAFWLYAARQRTDAAARSGFWLAAFLAALIVGAALLVRQAFQGAILTGPDMPTAEFYGYSLAGLAVSIGLLLAGVRLPDKALRLAGLALLTATILKVFLVDASALEGLLRILSFLGLGIVLIGIGRLYGPVLRAERGGTARPEPIPRPGIAEGEEEHR